MKKKEFNSRLKLRKNVISNLQSNSLHGGTDTIAYPVTYIIITTVKIATELYTKKPRMCPPDNSERCTTIPPTCTTCLDC